MNKTLEFIQKLPNEVKNKIFKYLQEPCAEILSNSYYFDEETPKPIFRNLNTKGHIRALYNHIHKDYNKYWEPYKNLPDYEYDTEEELEYYASQYTDSDTISNEDEINSIHSNYEDEEDYIYYSDNDNDN
jgi:hypothetical protein